MQSDQDTYILTSNVDEEAAKENNLKQENVVKTEYVEYDIMKEPKCELNVDILKREEEDVMDDRNNNKENVIKNNMDPAVKQGESSTKVCLLPVPYTQDGSDFGTPIKIKMVDQTGSLIGDKDKRKFFHQQLLQELVHARNCKNGSDLLQSQCNIPGCKSNRDLLSHTFTCQAGDMCTVVNCSISRLILSHFDNCSKPNCALCLPLKTQSGINCGSSSNFSQVPFGSNKQVRSPSIVSVEILRAKEVNLNLREERLRIREKVLEVRTKDLDKQKLELEKQEFALTVAQVNLWHREVMVKEREENLSSNGNLKAQNNVVVDSRTAETVGNRVSPNLMQAIIKEAPKRPNILSKRKIQGSEETLPRKNPRTILPRLLNITNGASYPLKPLSSDPFLPQFD